VESTDDEEETGNAKAVSKARITRAADVTSHVWWCLVFSVASVIIGLESYYFPGTLVISSTKRLRVLARHACSSRILKKETTPFQSLLVWQQT